MNNTNTGGPAFPVQSDRFPDGELLGERYEGMTLRDYFAAKALKYVVEHCTTYNRSAEEAYKIADAMLQARDAS